MQQLSAARGVMGVYVIVCTPTGQFHLGSSANVGDRWYRHRGRLRRGTHEVPLLQAAWTQYGEAAFRFLLVETVSDVDCLRPREQAWLDESRPYDPGVGFNRSPSTKGAGWQYTDEQRARLSAALTGLVRTPEQCRNMARTVTPEMRERMRKVGESGRGVPKSAEHRRKIGEPQRGSGNHRAILTEGQVREIKQRLAAEPNPGRYGFKAALAREFSISATTVRQIETGARWGHVIV